VLQAGRPVIVDATFLEHSQRSHFLELAEQLGVPALILRCEAEESVLRRRILERAAEGKDPSEAGLSVLEKQLGEWQPPDREEEASTLVIDSGPALQEADVIRFVRARLGLSG